MALSDYNLEFNLPFYDVDGNRWKLEIFDRDGVAVTPEELKGTDNPVSIYWAGDEQFSKGVIGSSCEINLYGTPNRDGTSDLSQFFVADEEKFYVKVSYQKGGAWLVYWVGFLHQDEYVEYITSDPYEVKLVALDRLGTLETRLNEVQNPTKAVGVSYFLDDTAVLRDLLESFAEATMLEFDVDEFTNIITENGITTTYLTDQEVNLDSYKDGGDNEFVQMIPLRDIINDIALSLFCRVYQSEGRLKFQQITGISDTSSVVIPTHLKQINDDLEARHNPAKRTTNIAYAVGSSNLLENPSFEKDALGTTGVITGWTKPYSGNNWEVSDEALPTGSNQSLKIVADRISDSTFDNASLATKLLNYTLFEAETKIPINLNVFRTIIGYTDYSQLARFRFSYFINNTFQSTYELRYSVSRWSDVNNAYVFWNFEAKSWGSQFHHAFLDADSTGEWQEQEFDLVVNLIDDDGNGGYPLIFRIHTHNYDVSLSNVEIFYDNFSIQMYNASGDSQSTLLPSANFFNVSTDSGDSTRSGSQDIELLSGLSTLETSKINVFNPDSPEWEILNKGLKGQYINIVSDKAEPVNVSGDVTPADPLQTRVKNLRKAFDFAAKKIFSSTLATHRVTDTSFAYSLFSDTNYTFTPSASATGITYTEQNTPPNRYGEFLTSVGYVGGIIGGTYAPTTDTLPYTGFGGEYYRMSLIENNLGSLPLGAAWISAALKCPVYGTILGQVIIDRNNPTGEIETTYVGDYDDGFSHSGRFEIVILGASSDYTPDSWSFSSVNLYLDSAVWTPKTFHNKLSIDYGDSDIYVDTAKKVFTRFSIDAKLNRYKADFINVP